MAAGIDVKTKRTKALTYYNGTSNAAKKEITKEESVK